MQQTKQLKKQKKKKLGRKTNKEKPEEERRTTKNIRRKKINFLKNTKEKSKFLIYFRSYTYNCRKA